jgi:hypothetical protein
MAMLSVEESNQWNEWAIEIARQVFAHEAGNLADVFGEESAS